MIERDSRSCGKLARHLAILSVWASLVLAQSPGNDSLLNSSSDSTGMGVLPFDWSGQSGIYHHYGFSGWGLDREEGPLFLDGNFAHWPQRYAFPFDGPMFGDGTEPGVRTTLWYQKGDYFLDEFAFDAIFMDESAHSYRIQALKRNFADQYGLMGPANNPAGTVQQNYRLLLRIPLEHDEQWELGSAYFITTDVIPTHGESGWSQGIAHLDRIWANGLAFAKKRGKVQTRSDLALFSQRLKLKALSGVPGWGADMISWRAKQSLHYSSTQAIALFLDAVVKYSAISSDSVGSQSRLVGTVVSGIERKVGNLNYRIAAGIGSVASETESLIYEGMANYRWNSLSFFLDIEQMLSFFPFQMSGMRFSGTLSDQSAISQERTIAKVRIVQRTEKSDLGAAFFWSRSAPLYFFETVGEDFVLHRKRSDHVAGLSWNGSVNYFRNWWITTSGMSFFENRWGWGNGVQHEGTVALAFQEFLFHRHLDARVRFWTNFWIGRNRYAWDPALSIGYYEKGDVYPRDSAWILNIEFKGVISTFEISYTMMNFLYAGRELVRSVFGDSITDDQLTLVGTPRLPYPGRLAYFTVRWNFRN